MCCAHRCSRREPLSGARHAASVAEPRRACRSRRRHPELRHRRRYGTAGAEDQLTAVRVAILSARQGWHTDQLCRALTERGYEGRVLPYEALVAHLGGGGSAPAMTAGDEDLGACAAVLARIIRAGSLGQIVFRVDGLHTLGS